jgi:hypothetical protein
MFIKRIIKQIPKTTSEMTPIFEPYCEKKFQQLLKDLNITVATLTMGKKEDDDKKKISKCD